MMTDLDALLTPGTLARRFHETYERLAPQFGYETRKASAVPWEGVPEHNKSLMIAVATSIGTEIGVAVRDLRAERDELAALRERHTTTLATLVHVLGIPGEDWQIEHWPEEYEGNVASLRPTCVCGPDDGGRADCYCCDGTNLTAAHVAVLDEATRETCSHPNAAFTIGGVEDSDGYVWCPDCRTNLTDA